MLPSTSIGGRLSGGIGTIRSTRTHGINGGRGSVFGSRVVRRLLPHYLAGRDFLDNCLTLNRGVLIVSSADDNRTRRFYTLLHGALNDLPIMPLRDGDPCRAAVAA